MTAGNGQFTLPLAEALRRAGKLDEALAVLAAAKTGDSRAAVLRARCLLDAGRPDEAQAVLKEVVATSPSDAQAHYLLGSALHAQRHWAEAEAEFTKSASMGGATLNTREAVRLVDATRRAQELMDQALTPPAPPVRR